MKHKLKTWPEYFEAVFQHKKDFEIRKDDRNFQVRDELLLQEWDNETQLYTGREILVYVDYILPGGQFGLENGFVCMSIKSY
jgi:hypothetical protein